MVSTAHGGIGRKLFVTHRTPVFKNKKFTASLLALGIFLEAWAALC
jgi:hypothetical protein